MRVENQTKNWEDSSLCPETSNKNAVQEFHLRTVATSALAVRSSNHSDRSLHNVCPVFSTGLFTLTWSQPTFCWWRADSSSSISGLPAASNQTRQVLSRFQSLFLLATYLNFLPSLASSVVIICLFPIYVVGSVIKVLLFNPSKCKPIFSYSCEVSFLSVLGFITSENLLFSVSVQYITLFIFDSLLIRSVSFAVKNSCISVFDPIAC